MNRLFAIAFGVTSLTVLILAIIPSPDIPGDPNDKLLHVLAFFVLAILAVGAFPSVQLRRLWVLLTGFAAAIEILQLIMQQGRQAEWNDLIAGMIGAAVALLLTLLFRRAAAVLSA